VFERAVFERAVRYGLRRGLRSGLIDGSRVWLAVGAAAVGVRVLQRLTRPPAADTVREELAPGQALVITHLVEPS
jgi:hypothetical protein